jgi:hypothetical protein
VASPSGLCLAGAGVSRMLLESDDTGGCINFSEFGGSDVAFAQEENWNETLRRWKKSRMVMSEHDSDIKWVWHTVQTSYKGQKISFTGLCEPQKNVESFEDIFNVF